MNHGAGPCSVCSNALQERERNGETFDVAMTLVAAGYRIAIAPAARLASYLRRGHRHYGRWRTDDRGWPTCSAAMLPLSDTQASRSRRARVS